ncbi:KxYKxGKxW signal peptide domain-containing protein, partial [Lactovum odontotermitis]
MERKGSTMSYQHQKKKLSDKSNTHYRTWKKGKNWCYSFSILAALTGAAILSSETVNADVPEIATTDTAVAVPDLTQVVTETTSTNIMPEKASEILPTTETDSTLDTKLIAAPVSEEKTARTSSDAHSVSADITLLTGGQTTAEQPSNTTMSGDSWVELGISGTFTVNSSDLVAENTIVIAEVTQTPDASGLLVNLAGDTSIALRDDNGTTIGTISYDNSLKAIVLQVSADFTGSDTPLQSFSFKGAYAMMLNYRTPSSIISEMPFSNTISVSGKSYTFNFTALAENDATRLDDDGFSTDNNTAGSWYYDWLYHEVIPSDETLADLQESSGSEGDVSTDEGLIRSYKVSSGEDITSVYGGIYLGSYYVSAASGKIQSLTDDKVATEYTYIYTIASFDAGDEKTTAELQTLATESGTGTYYSLQKDGSYLVVQYLSPEDMVLSDEKIAANVRNNPLAATSKDVEADVAATIAYYH